MMQLDTFILCNSEFGWLWYALINQQQYSLKLASPMSSGLAMVKNSE